VHGALATIFVHAEGAQNSVAALRAPIGAVASAPWTRALHLVLEGKGEGHDAGLSAEALCDRLGLFDDRSIVSIAPGSAEHASKAVRDLLARLLP
jgi:hypothetical protein